MAINEIKDDLKRGFFQKKLNEIESHLNKNEYNAACLQYLLFQGFSGDFKLPSSVDDETLDRTCSVLLQIVIEPAKLHETLKIKRTTTGDWWKITPHKLFIKLSPDDLIKIPRISVIGGKLKSGKYQLKKIDSDLAAILSHELIHVRHSIEDPDTYDRDGADHGGYWNQWRDDANAFQYLWQIVEEQRAVIGKNNLQEECELTMRYGSQLPLRYPYRLVEEKN